MSTRRDGAADKRRVILDAAIRVFAREGFHRCRVSDIANEANVAYGLVYHYFRSKDEVLDTLFTERWSLLLEAIAEADRSDAPVRDKLHAIAVFIIDSYRNDPDLMKVIIVEVTRAANTFGRAHLDEIRQAYDGISRIVAHGQEDGTFRSDISAGLRDAVLLRRDRAAADSVDLRRDPEERRRVRAGQADAGRDHLRRPRGPLGRQRLAAAEVTAAWYTPSVSRARTLMRILGRLPLRASFRTFPDSRTDPRRRVTVTLRAPFVESFEICSVRLPEPRTAAPRAPAPFTATALPFRRFDTSTVPCGRVTLSPSMFSASGCRTTVTFSVALRPAAFRSEAVAAGGQPAPRGAASTRCACRCAR